MKVSINWLNQFVKVDDIDPTELAEKLTFAGVEVEDVTRLASATNLVIGKIIACEKHPDSDHLHVLKVDEGERYGIHQIVCGAPNARTGLKVIVARTGAVLPEVTIEKSEIRGVESDGMCCALYELGVDKKYLSEKQLSGIEELNDDAKVGEENVLGYLGLDDVILNLKLLANRPDLNAMENVAREVGCLLNRPVTIPAYSLSSREKTDFEVGSQSEKCPQFGISIVRGVQTKPSPSWLQEILTSEGIRSINNVVDIGNFVMLLTGQPLNMYDLDKLPKHSLIVKDDWEGDFVAMDGKTYPVQKGDLMVTSDAQPMCLAGIMTSMACAVDEKTVNVAIESAVFNGASIRHTSNRLGLSSESSARFVKGLNKDQALRVLTVAGALLMRLAGASSVSEAVNFDVLSHQKHVISTSLDYINRRLGTSFGYEEVMATLRRDNLVVTPKEGDAFDIEVPSFRIDMAGEADVSEEVIRLLGFSHVTSKMPTIAFSSKGGLRPEQKDKASIRRFLRHYGLDECITYSLVNKKEKDAFAYLSTGECYRLKNPMTDDHEYLRKNLLRSLLDVASYNCAHQEKNLALFEISDVDAPNLQGTRLSVVFVGEEPLQGDWVRRPYDFYSVKGVFEGIMSLLSINENRYRIVPLTSDKAEFHPGRSAGVYLGKTLIGVMGEFHPSVLKDLGLGKCAAGMELDLKAILELKTSPDKAIIPAKFPSVSRDLAFVLPKEILYEDVKREIARTDKLIRGVEIFDLYEGANIAEGKKSLALNIVFLDDEKTLKDEEVNAVMDKIIGTLKMRFNAEIRS